MDYKLTEANEVDFRQRIFCALDTSSLDRALSLSERLKGRIGGLKIGKEFFSYHGPQGVREIQKTGMPVFLDQKYHDIPNTVAGAVSGATALQPFMLNVHASGGEAMMRAARKAVDVQSKMLGLSNPPLLIAVTVLTSLSEEDVKRNGVSAPLAEQVTSLAILAKECGLDGVVCSGHELQKIRSACGEDFKTVVPGLRPPWPQHDQRRVMSPEEAYCLGADYLVIGRPITDCRHPDTKKHLEPDEAVELIVDTALGRVSFPVDRMLA